MDFLTSVFITLLVIALIHRYLKGYLKRRRIAKIIDQLPGEKKYPLVGTYWKTLGATRENFYEIYKATNRKYGPFYRAWLGNIPVIMTWKPEHIQTVLTSSRNINKSDSYNFLKAFLSDGLFTSQGEKWRQDRKLITPSFHLQILENFMPIFNERSRTFAEQFETRCGADEYFDMIPLLEQLSFDFICETSMGMKINAVEGKNVFYLQAFINVFQATVRRIFNPLIHHELAFYLSGTGRFFRHHLKHVKKFILDGIEKRHTLLQNSLSNNEDNKLHKKRRMVLIDNLLEAHKTLKNCDYNWLYVQVFTFVFAGFDTTASALMWALYALATNPKVQSELFDEITKTFEGDFERDVTLQDLKDMEFLNRTVKEVLRLYTVAPVMGRKIDEDIILDNIKIPAGCTISIQLGELHKDPKIYPEPKKFDPDRFLPENASKRHPYSYVPFSAGYRNCIGQKFSEKSTRVALIHILRKYEVFAKTAPEEIKYFQDTTIKPQGGLLLKLKKRIE